MEDTQLLDDVRNGLEWDPAVNAAHIGVSANASAVALTGYVNDTRISEAIMSAFLWHNNIPESVKAEVENGYVTLSGDAEWAFQRREAAELARGIKGVLGLTNLIALQPRVEAKDLRDRVAQALKRNADLDARSIDL